MRSSDIILSIDIFSGIFTNDTWIPRGNDGYLQISISGNACDIASQSVYHAVFVFNFEEA